MTPGCIKKHDVTKGLNFEGWSFRCVGNALLVLELCRKPAGAIKQGLSFEWRLVRPAGTTAFLGFSLGRLRRGQMGAC